MKPRSYTSEGIILSKRNLGEADKIITIFSRDFGKLALIAKGIRRTKSRKRGHLEIFNLIKFQAVVGKSMDIILEADVIDDFHLVRKNLRKISLAYYFCEVITKIVNDNEANLSIFNLFLANLITLQKQNLLKELRLKFVHELLIITGYHPKGETLVNHDKILEEVLEQRINSLRVGKRMLQ